MAKQPKKPPASAAPAKPAAKKTAAKKPTAKPKAKAATGKTTAAKPAAKKTATKPATNATKPTAKKTAAKKTATKPAAKATKTAAKKTAPVSAALAGANPVITSPANNAAVPANANLPVTVTTDQVNLSYVVTVTDITARPKVVATLNAPGPVTDPFMVTVPGGVLPPGRTFRITVSVEPPGVGTSNSVTVTT